MPAGCILYCGIVPANAGSAGDASYPGVTEMNKFGMSIINDATGIMNGSTNSHVYWGWKAAGGGTGATVTNNSGTITSQVSANPSAGFSIVTWTGTGATSNIYVGHGLGAVPQFIISKERSQSTNWSCYHVSIGNTANIFLNSTNGINTTSAAFNNTTPSRNGTIVESICTPL